MVGKRFAFAFVTALLCAVPVQAQIVNGHQWPTPRLSILTPTGGKVATTVEVTFTGTECEEPEALIFNHPGIKGAPVVPPLPPVDPKAKDKKDPVRPPITKFTVTIDKSVPVGFYDARLVNKHGVSNSRRFVVGDLNEVAEKEPNNDVEQAQKVEIGTTISGVIAAATDVDYFSFAGKKGQRILVTCLTASIDSRLDPLIEVISPKGQKIGVYQPILHVLTAVDGLVDVTLPEDGDYLVRLSKFTHVVANAEYFYRLNIALAPYIDAVFPNMIEPGKTAQVTLYGRNLPGGVVDPKALIGDRVLEKLTVSITAPGDPASIDQLKYFGLTTPLLGSVDGFEYRFTGPTGTSNPVLLTYAKAPVVIENDDNDVPAKAQAVPVPCHIAGRIDKKGDRDWYVFDAKKDQVLMIEIASHRLGAHTDIYAVVKNLATKQDFPLVDENVDSPSLRFFTGNNLDPAPFRFVAPADGKYHLLIVSHTGENYADPTHLYQVRITPEKPDFRLLVMPADETRPDTCRVGQGGTHHYTVYAQRSDGFKGDITLTMELPDGVTCAPQVLAGGMRFTQLVVSAADNAAPYSGAVKVVGTATINGQKVVHQARPASITWGVPIQQNIQTVTRLDRELMLAVRGKAPAKFVAAKDKVAVSLGDKIEVPLKLTRTDADFKANFQVAPVPGELPAGMAFANLAFAPGKDDLNAVVTVAPNVPPGAYNIVFRGFATISPSAKAKPVNTILVSTPVTVIVLPKQVATLTVDNANPTIKAGGDGMITVKVARMYDFADAFKVELVLPPGVKGVSGDPITIAANANEAKMTLKIAAGTPPANLPNLTVRATAVVNGNVTLTHETKINVIVAK
ncbi:MAG: hypothetical protein HY289_02105 [Planctomycetes bacterium]|nr:hypothetical protein [Planctomycetota bacterium]